MQVSEVGLISELSVPLLIGISNTNDLMVQRELNSPHYDKTCDAHGAYRIGHHPAVPLNQRGRNDYANTAEGVGQDVQENPCLNELK